MELEIAAYLLTGALVFLYKKMTDIYVILENIDKKLNKNI